MSIEAYDVMPVLCDSCRSRWTYAPTLRDGMKVCSDCVAEGDPPDVPSDIETASNAALVNGLDDLAMHGMSELTDEQYARYQAIEAEIAYRKTRPKSQYPGLRSWPTEAAHG